MPMAATAAPTPMTARNGFVLGWITKIRIQVIAITMIAVLRLSVKKRTPPDATAPSTKTRMIPSMVYAFLPSRHSS